MNKYFVVATAKYPVILRGKHYKIGETVPSELTEKEYEFYKHALNIESMKEINAESKSTPINTVKFDFISAEQFKEMYAVEYEKLKEHILKENAETLAIVEKELKAKSANALETTETEVKPKRPYAKKETK